MEENEFRKNKSSLVTTNRMSVKELMEKENSKVVFHDFEDKNGKMHSLFTCGSISGYVSPNAVKEMKNNANFLDNLVYAEVSKDGGRLVPCLMIDSKRSSVSIKSDEDKKENCESTSTKEQSSITLVFRNSITAKELIIKQNALLKFYDYDDIDGERHTYFTCGSVTGKVSPKVKREINNKECSVDDFVYVDISKHVGETVPYIIWKDESLLELQKTIGPELIKDQDTEQEISSRLIEKFEEGISEAKKMAKDNNFKPPFDTLVIKDEISKRYQKLNKVINIDNSLKSKCEMAGIDYISLLNKTFVKYYAHVKTFGTTSDNFNFTTIEGPLANGADFQIEGENKESEIRNHLTYLMVDFIQSTYGDINVTKDNIDNANILTVPLTNACIMYEDNESFIDTCNICGLDYHKILFEASQQVIRYYLSKDNPTYNDLPI